MVVRLGDGTAESHAKMQAAIDDAWRFTGELFFDDAVDQDPARGIGCLLSELREPWARHVAEVLGEATLSVPDAAAASHPAHRGGRQGRHSEELGYVLAEMQFLPRAYPGAKW